MVRSGGVSNYLTTNFYAANNAALAYSDCVAPSFVGGYARFRRPIADGGNYEYCMPGARLRFRSNAQIVNVLLRYNGLCARTDSRNVIGDVYVDGVFVKNFSGPYALNVVGVHRLNIVNVSAADRLYEIILPYGDAVEFGGVEVDQPYTISSADPRTGRLMVCYGDSITQGFFASEVQTSWPFLLAAQKGFRCVNMGYGGRTTTPADGTVLGGMGADLITVMMGTNDYLNQTPVLTYLNNFKAFLTNLHNVNPTVPVYVTSPLPNSNSRTIPFSSYVTIPGQAVNDLGYSQLIGVVPLLPDATGLPDGTHPNDATSVLIANSWAAAIS